MNIETKCLSVGCDSSEEKDITIRVVKQQMGNKIQDITTFYGDEATEVYKYKWLTGKVEVP